MLHPWLANDEVQQDPTFTRQNTTKVKMETHGYDGHVARYVGEWVGLRPYHPEMTSVV